VTRPHHPVTMLPTDLPGTKLRLEFMAKSPTVVLDPTQDQALVTWQQINNDLAAMKAIELQYRQYLAASIPFDPSKSEGSQTVELPDGRKLSLDRPMNYTLAKDNATVSAALYALYAINPGAAVDIVKWVPELSITAYKKLTDDERRIIAPIVIAKPGLLALELKTPKKGEA
jgi:hypothetical protein